MKQHVNLYQGTLRRESPAFSASMMALCVGLGALLMLGGWAIAGHQARALQEQAAAAEAREQALAARLDALTRTYAPDAADPAQADTLETVLAGLARRERVLALVEGEGMGDTVGFSDTLAALAQQETRGLWLTRILVSAPGARTTLEGRATAPFLVPAYLMSLSSEVALAGQRFDQFRIERPDGPGVGPVRFSMTSDNNETFARSGDLP